MLIYYNPNFEVFVYSIALFILGVVKLRNF